MATGAANDQFCIKTIRTLARNTPQVRRGASLSAATVTSRTSTRVQRPRLTSRFACWSIIGAGPACRLILRSGKAMTRRDTEIALQFRQAPLTFFRGTAVEACIPHWLVLQIQPDEGILLQFGAKVAQLGGAARRGHT
jgi:hypothetical protein